MGLLLLLMPKTPCNNYCIRQDKYETKNKRRYRNPLDRWCNWCNRLFIDCTDIKCICCDTKLLYKAEGSIITYRERMVRINGKNSVNKKLVS